MDVYQAIYAEIAAFSEPARLPAPWRGLPATPAYRGPLRDFRAVASHLRKKFCDENLISAGVFVRSWEIPQNRAAELATSASGLKFNPQLLLGSWLILQRGANDPPFEIVTRGGCLSRRQPPVLAALEDAEIKDLLEWSGKNLLATLTLADAAVLLSLDFPAIPVVGLQKLQGPLLAKLWRHFDVRHLHRDDNEDAREDQEAEAEERQLEINSRRADPQPTSPPADGRAPGAADVHAEDSAQAAFAGSIYRYTRYALTVVDFHPAALSLALPGQYRQLQARFAGLANHLGLLMDQFLIWQPAPTLLSSIRSALANGVPRHARRLIGASQARSTRPLIEDACGKNLSAAPEEGFQRLREFWDERSDRSQQFQRLLGEQISGPLYSAVDAATDPVSKARALAYAMYVDQQLGIFDRLNSSRGGRSSAPAGPLSKDEINQQRSLQQSLINILTVTDPMRNTDSGAASRSP